MTRIERIRKRKLSPKWIGWGWGIGALGWLIMVMLNSQEPLLAGLQACLFAAFAYLSYAQHRLRLDKELVAEIDRLQRQLDEFHSNEEE